MNAKDRFNDVIRHIEERAFSGEYRRAGEIAEEVCRMTGLGIREINAVFIFLTGGPLLEYIKDRKMMAAYSELIKGERFDVSRALEIAGYDNQSSFGKRFRERFGMTPSEAYARKAASMFRKPSTWDHISADRELPAEVLSEVKSVSHTVFGIDRERYARIQQAEDYKVLFGMDEVQSEVAFRLAEAEHADMLAAFEFVEEFVREFCLDREHCFTMSQRQLEKAIGERRDLLPLCLELGHTVYRAAYIAKVLGYYKLKVSEVPLEDLKHFHWGEESFSDFMEKYIHYYRAGRQVPIEEFLDLVYGENLEPELAAYGEDWMDVLGGGIENMGREMYLMHREYEEFDPIFEKWADEETNYANTERFDHEPDMDNLAYDPYENQEDLFNG